MLPVARDPRFETEDISVIAQLVFWICVKIARL